MVDLREDELSDKDNYCIHGNFTGSPDGADYLCGLCEASADRMALVFQSPVVAETPWGIFLDITWEDVRESGVVGMFDYFVTQFLSIRLRKPWTRVWVR